MLSFFLLLTFVMLQHALLQLLSFKIAFLKSDQRAFCNVGVDGHRKVAHLGLVFLITNDQFEQNTLQLKKTVSAQNVATSPELTSPSRALPPSSIRLPVNSEPERDDADAIPRLLRLLSYLRLSKLSATLLK